MSKNNFLRARINKTEISNKSIRVIYHKLDMDFDSWYWRGHDRQYRTWKHNRNKQYKT